MVNTVNDFTFAGSIFCEFWGECVNILWERNFGGLE